MTYREEIISLGSSKREVILVHPCLLIYDSLVRRRDIGFLVWRPACAWQQSATAGYPRQIFNRPVHTPFESYTNINRVDLRRCVRWLMTFVAMQPLDMGNLCVSDEAKDLMRFRGYTGLVTP